MNQLKVKELKEGALERILLDAFNWLVHTYGDQSFVLNKLNYRKKYSSFKPYSFKHDLKICWSSNPRSMDWSYNGQLAEYNGTNNTMYILCRKNYTIEYVLDSLFHEFKHSQQNMTRYVYYCGVLNIPYTENPLENEAVQFAKENVEKFLKFYSEKVAEEELRR